MFSYKGNCSLFLENNDGTVELSSELDQRAQKEADRIFGYNEDHGSILFSERVQAQINDLLKLGPGSAVSLSRLESEPVDILANDTLIARGQVVIQDKKYGIRVTEITSRIDRIKSLS